MKTGTTSKILDCQVIFTKDDAHKEGRELDLTVADGILGEIRR